jgi:hypothetical protein
MDHTDPEFRQVDDQNPALATTLAMVSSTPSSRRLADRHRARCSLVRATMLYGCDRVKIEQTLIKTSHFIRITAKIGEK